MKINKSFLPDTAMGEVICNRIDGDSSGSGDVTMADLVVSSVSTPEAIKG
jgi:hypothetical protein